MGNLVDTLSNDDISSRAGDDLDKKVHFLELRGEIVIMLNATKPAGEAGWCGLEESSLKLVAGARFGHCFSKLSEVRIAK